MIPVGWIKHTVPFTERYATLEEYAFEYEGYDEDNIRDGRIGCLTNPNKKWDWWVIGGRW